MVYIYVVLADLFLCDKSSFYYLVVMAFVSFFCCSDFVSLGSTPVTPSDRICDVSIYFVVQTIYEVS